MVQSARPSTASPWTSRPTSACSFVCSTSTDWSALPIAPISVRLPVARTSATPWPCTTRDPENTNGWSSPPGRAAACWPSQFTLRTGTDSPVRSDSSVARLLQDRTAASAGTRSPSVSTRISPGTTSRPAMRRCKPSRTTSARGLDRSRRASSARSVFRS